MTTPLIPQAAQNDFAEITQLIALSRQRAVQAVNTALIELYWQVGQIISRKIEQAAWGDGVVGWWRNWLTIWRKPSRACGDLPAQICFACGSSTRRTETMK